SGFSNTAVSRAKAVGMWQFMASTARLYGLTVDPWVDERRDPYKATEAAVNYLADLRERLGSVYLAAAAYNAGVGRIERGIARLPDESSWCGCRGDAARTSRSAMTACPPPTGSPSWITTSRAGRRCRKSPSDTA